jgi:hypothetical protein
MMAVGGFSVLTSDGDNETVDIHFDFIPTGLVAQ